MVAVVVVVAVVVIVAAAVALEGEQIAMADEWLAGLTYTNLWKK